MGARHVGFVLIAIIVLGIAGLAFRLLSVETEGKVLSGLKPLSGDLVDKVVMRDNETSSVIVKRADGSWWSGPYPVLDTKLTQMWETAQLFDGAELVATNPENHQHMGVLPQNGTLVQFWDGADLYEEFLVGDKAFAPVPGLERIIRPWTPQSSMCYVRRPREDDVYGVHCPFPDRFDTDERFWKLPIIAAIPPQDIEVLTYTFSDEEFDLRIINSVWFVVKSDGSEQAVPDLALSVLRQLETLITFEFVTQETADTLNFGQPHASMGIGTRADSLNRSMLLLFLDRGDGSYYVKDAENPFIYVLEPARAGIILKRSAGFLPAASAAP